MAAGIVSNCKLFTQWPQINVNMTSHMQRLITLSYHSMYLEIECGLTR